MAHHHLRLHLSHGLEGYADDDQDRRTSEGPVCRLGEVEMRDEDRRRNGDRGEEERAGERESAQHAVEIRRRGRLTL